MEAEWDGVQHVHNGYVRQGWILLINPTGYIVPSARDGRTASSVPCFVPEDAPLRWSSAARSSTFYSPLLRESGILLSG